jgi:tetratricopeptide (TPR) repeat protein
MDSSSKHGPAPDVTLDESFEARRELRQLVTQAAATGDGSSRKGRVSVEPEAYDAIFRKIAWGTGEVQKRLRQERKTAGDQWPILESHPQRRRLLMIRNDRRLRSWGLYHCLLERYRTLVEHQLRKAGEAAELAVEVARSLNPAEHGVERTADFLAGALAALGDSRRRLCDFTGARKALEEAREALERGTGDPLEEAELEHLWGKLQEDLGDQQEAERAFRRASTLYRRIGDPRLQPVSPADPGRKDARRHAGGR